MHCQAMQLPGNFKVEEGGGGGGSGSKVKRERDPWFC